MVRTKYPIEIKQEQARQRTIQQVKTNQQDPIGSPAWLKKAVLCDMNLVLREACRMKAHDLLEVVANGRFERKRNWPEKKKDTEMLCANLLVQKRKLPVAISMLKNRYTNTTASYFVPDLVHFLIDGKWIEMKVGYKNSNTGEGELTKIWPTQKFLSYFDDAEKKDLESLKLVQLREKRRSKDHDPQLLFYENTPETTRIEEILGKSNFVCREHSIQLKTKKGFERLDTDLHAVFNGSFEEGGRLYKSGRDHYQSLSEDDRRNIYIDSKETVELDFSGLHPRLLYAEEGIQYDGDVYLAICPEEPKLRDIWKTVMLSMINAKNEKEANQSCNEAINHRSFDKHRRVMHRGTKENRLEVKDLIEMVKTAHKRIAHHFCTAPCHRLTNKDSKMALEVIEYFTNRNIPVLCIHDSFIVQKKYQDRLESVMGRAYYKYSGGFTCPIK